MNDIPNKKIAVSIRGVSKSFSTDTGAGRLFKAALFNKPLIAENSHQALSDVSFTVSKGDVFGILGENGSGKSTLLQIICNIMEPTAGVTKVKGHISALLELGAGFNPEFTGEENLFINGAIRGIGRAEMKRRIPEIRNFADIGKFFYQPVKTYSSGMFVRLAFASAIHIDPDILVIDEALSVGDVKFQHKCFNKIREFIDQGKTIIVVSHSTNTLLEICNRGMVLSKGELSFIGNIKDCVDHYQNLMFSDDNIDLPYEIKIENQNQSLLGEKNKIIEDQLPTHRLYNKGETRLGNRKVEIVAASIKNNGLETFNQFTADSKIELEITIYFHQDQKNVSIGFGVVSLEGSYVFGTNMSIMGKSLIEGRGGDQKTIRFVFTNNVGGGNYFINLGCNEIIGKEDIFLDVRRSILFFDVKKSKNYIGPTRLDVITSIDP